MSPFALAATALAIGLAGLADARHDAPDSDATQHSLAHLVPGGKCPADMPRAVSTKGPRVKGPGSGQKVVVMSLPKMGSSTFALVMAELGYGSSHDLGDVLGCEGVEVISNACETDYLGVDQRHPEATWIVLYDHTFMAWFASEVKWLWLVNCPKGNEDPEAMRLLWRPFMDEAAAAFGEELLMSSEELKSHVLSVSKPLCKDRKKRANKSLLESMAQQFMVDEAFVAAVRQRYDLYHAYLHCFLEHKPHLVMDVRADPAPYATLEPWVRNGTSPMNPDQALPAVNVHGEHGARRFHNIFTITNQPPGECEVSQC